MKATQFIKDHGLEKAREVVEGAPAKAQRYCPEYESYYKQGKATWMFLNGYNGWTKNDVYDEVFNEAIDLSVLKRLVESVDFVKTYGGIVMAKRQLDLFLRVNLEQGTALSNTVSRLKDAVADYESIYGEGNE